MGIEKTAVYVCQHFLMHMCVHALTDTLVGKGFIMTWNKLGCMLSYKVLCCVLVCLMILFVIFHCLYSLDLQMHSLTPVAQLAKQFCCYLLQYYYRKS